jgi:hypothetical protein
MVFASPVFLLLFLPLTLGAYLLARGQGKNVVLLVASVVFYVWGEGRFIALLVASVAANWSFGRAIAASEDPRTRRRWLVAAVTANLAALGFFKYTGFALANVNELAAEIGMTGVALAAIPLPLGISFFTFHAISYVVDVYKRNAEAEPRLPVFALYIMLFPQLIAGPIIRWRDIAAQLSRRETRLADFAFAPLKDFPPRFERALADQFGSRRALLLFQHAVVAGLFRTSPAPNVLMGREGWLYWLGEDGRSLDRNFRGTLAVQDAELAAVAAELKRRGDFLAARGIPYVVTIVPEKFTIYPEYLPPWVAPAVTPTPLSRLERLLAEDGTVRYVDLVQPLRGAKSSALLYYRTDSHWNLLGATVGYERIMRALQGALPEERLQAIAAPVRPAYVPGVDWYWGDLARMVGVPYLFREPDYAPLAKVLSDRSGRCAQQDAALTDPGFEVYHCARPGLPKAVVYRDSMAVSLIPLLSENFSRVVYVTSLRLDRALIERERPDVVIEEMVERNLLAPAQSAM